MYVLRKDWCLKDQIDLLKALGQGSYGSVFMSCYHQRPEDEECMKSVAKIGTITDNEVASSELAGKYGYGPEVYADYTCEGHIFPIKTFLELYDNPENQRIFAAKLPTIPPEKIGVLVMEKFDMTLESKLRQVQDDVVTEENFAEMVTLAEETLHVLNGFRVDLGYHNDLKPDNIMLSAQGNNVHLIDFGLAVMVGGTYTNQNPLPPPSRHQVGWTGFTMISRSKTELLAIAAASGRGHLSPKRVEQFFENYDALCLVAALKDYYLPKRPGLLGPSGEFIFAFIKLLIKQAPLLSPLLLFEVRRSTMRDEIAGFFEPLLFFPQRR